VSCTQCPSTLSTRRTQTDIYDCVTVRPQALRPSPTVSPVLPLAFASQFDTIVLETFCGGRGIEDCNA
jgi:hypothetical protein